MDQLRPFKASFYGVNIRTFPLGCFVYSFPEPALPAALSHPKNTIFLLAKEIAASQRLISGSAFFPGAWATIPKGLPHWGGMQREPLSGYLLGSNWFCWWTWYHLIDGTSCEISLFQSFQGGVSTFPSFMKGEC